MAKKSSNLSQYKIWMHPDVHVARKKLPGKVRQRIKRAIDDLAHDPHPPNSIPLRLPKSVALNDWEVKRIRLDEWRIVYAVSEAWSELGILTVQKRPPYDYEDIADLIARL